VGDPGDRHIPLDDRAGHGRQVPERDGDHTLRTNEAGHGT
jgi:hypothetical protein